MKFTTLVPTHDSDGLPFPKSLLARMVARLWHSYLGMTNEGVVTGAWVDEEETTHQDECLKISVECDREQLPEVLRRVKRVGQRLGQKAMYLEILGYDGVQIVRIEQLP